MMVFVDQQSYRGKRFAFGTVYGVAPNDPE
jgi:hypothetical protein